MSQKIGPRELELMARREAIAQQKFKLNSLSVPARAGLRIKSRPKKSEPIGDGVALTSAAHPPGLIDAMAKAIKSGKLSLKRGRGRPKKEGKKPWEVEGISRAQWYRRQAEKAGK